MDIRVWNRSFVAVVLPLLLVSAESWAQRDAGLFVEIAQPPQPRSIPDTIVRSRAVLLNPDAFPSVNRRRGDSVRMNFFEGVDVEVILDRQEVRGPEDYTWIGHVAGEGDGGTATLVVKGDVLVGNVRSEEEGYYQIRMNARGDAEVREIDETQFAPCETDESDHVRTGGSLPAFGSSFGTRDTADFFDVMVVYTPAARVAAGGTAAMEALINLAVAETNTAYEESQIYSRARLVHQQEIAYTEVNSSTDLGRLAGTLDGNMDTVHALRTTYGADLVSLFADYASTTCGRAYVMTSLSAGFATSAFSVVSYNCATGYYSFAHEMAHNMGSTHAQPESGQGSALYNYSMGWRWNNDTQRSIMAYAPGTRVARFSNPNVLYNGFPTGQPLGQADEAYNALSINNAASTVADWKPTVVGDMLTPDDDLYSSGLYGGPFSPSSEVYTLENITGSSMNWTATTAASWIDVSSGSGTLGSGATTNITVSINSGANSLPPGTHTDAVVFTDTTNDIVLHRFVSLTVTSPLVGSDEFSSTNVGQTIDGSGVVMSTLTVSGLLNVLDVNVALNISHTYVSDLIVSVQSPEGTSVTLFSGVGGNGVNFTNTILDDEASTSIASGMEPFTGSYSPSSPLSAFDGEDPNGTWTLSITDTFPSADDGTLNAWSVTIGTNQTGPTDVVYVGFGNDSTIENGSSDWPWNLLQDALSVVDNDGEVMLQGDSPVTESTETFSGGSSIDQPVRLNAQNGSVLVGTAAP